MDAANLYSSQAPIRALVEQYGEQELKFLSFPGAPDFGVKGALSIDVSGEEEAFGGQFYLYRYLYGRLYYLTSSYDADNGELNFTPSRLGTYVISNKELKTGAVSGGSDSGSAGGSSEGGPSNGSGSQPNPDTGANDAAGVALALAMASAAAAVTAYRRKK